MSVQSGSDNARAFDRSAAWVPAATGVLLALPFLLVRYPPMGDLAFHEAGVALLRHFGDPRFEPPGLYAYNLGQPNQLFHLCAYALSFVVATDTACKIVVAATVLALPLAAAHLASHLAVTRWSAVIVAPLALGWMTRWGLVANLLGFTLLLALLPLLDRAVRAPTLRRTSAAIAAVLLLYFAHESSMVLYAVGALVFGIESPRRPLPRVSAWPPALAAGALALVYHLRSAAVKAPSVIAVTPIDVSVVERLLDLPSALYGRDSHAVVQLSAAVSSVLMLVALSRPSSQWLRDRPWRLLAFGVACLGAYFVIPEALFGSTLVFQRFLPPAFVALVLSLLPRSTAPRAAPLLLALPIVALGVSWHAFVEADKSSRDLDVVLARMEDGAAVAQLDLTPRDPSVVAPVVGEAARALAEHGGRLLFSFTDAPTYPVTMPPERRWNEPVARLAMTPFAFAPAYDLTRFRYVLVRTTSARVRAVLPEAFAPEARLLLQQGHWQLFESTLPTCSLVAPDEGPPMPLPTPLATRVKALLARRNN